MAALSFPVWVIGCRFANQLDLYASLHSNIVNPDWPSALLQAAGCSLVIFVIALIVTRKQRS